MNYITKPPFGILKKLTGVDFESNEIYQIVSIGITNVPEKTEYIKMFHYKLVIDVELLIDDYQLMFDKYYQKLYLKTLDTLGDHGWSANIRDLGFQKDISTFEAHCIVNELVNYYGEKYDDRKEKSESNNSKVSRNVQE